MRKAWPCSGPWAINGALRSRSITLPCSDFVRVSGSGPRRWRPRVSRCVESWAKAGMANALIALGDVARKQNDHRQAVQRYLESLALLRIVGDMVATAECLEGLAADALARQQEARAVWLYSVAA